MKRFCYIGICLIFMFSLCSLFDFWQNITPPKIVVAVMNGDKDYVNLYIENGGDVNYASVFPHNLKSRNQHP
jgi:hypothetical protein